RPMAAVTETEFQACGRPPEGPAGMVHSNGPAADRPPGRRPFGGVAVGRKTRVVSAWPPRGRKLRVEHGARKRELGLRTQSHEHYLVRPCRRGGSWNLLRLARVPPGAAAPAAHPARAGDLHALGHGQPGVLTRPAPGSEAVVRLRNPGGDLTVGIC